MRNGKRNRGEVLQRFGNAGTVVDNKIEQREFMR